MQLLTDGPAGARHTVVLAHGAGAPMDSPFMQTVAEGLAGQRVRVVRFEFPYMAARRLGERGGPPDRERVLLATWRQVIAALGKPDRLVIGGKSLGGRMASMIADEQGVRGVVCFGYPFHPPGRGDRLRTAHLQALRSPMLVLQGERDPCSTRPEVAGYRLSKSIELCWLPDGDHSLKPRIRSGHTEAGNIAMALEATHGFLARLPG
jgi:predicted alpha/beta-hydrolase family hydrolase